MAAHWGPREEPITNRKGRSATIWPKPAAVKCSGLLGGAPTPAQALQHLAWWIRGGRKRHGFDSSGFGRTRGFLRACEASPHTSDLEGGFVGGRLWRERCGPSWHE